MPQTPAVVLLNFGEPETPSRDEVVAYLERIFLANRRLQAEGTDGAGRARALAEGRAPEYGAELEAIGGSPLHGQTRDQAELLAAELRGRGRGMPVLVAMQFTAPDAAEAVDRARDAGADAVVAVPLYPLCGPSTTVPALEALRRDATAAGLEVREVPGWHRHPSYTRLRADGIAGLCRDRGLDLGDPATRLVFSAHGTPEAYLRAGSRYDRYVREHAGAVAGALGVARYDVGYQNHGSRPGVEWTRPEVGELVRSLDVERVVVEPTSFMQEQSETLFELDRELRQEAEDAGLAFHRVPIAHDDPRFGALLADLVEWTLDDRGRMLPCQCRPVPGATCLNGGREPRPAVVPAGPPPPAGR
jgi:ferrochelatase